MANWTNTNKSSTTFSNQSFGNLTQWASASITWASPVVGWAALKADGYVNQTKSATTFTNQTKN